MGVSSDYVCCIDSAEGEPHCLFDTGDVDSCDEAQELSQNGRGKFDCPHWRHVQSIQDTIERLESENKVMNKLKIEALNMQETIAANAIEALHRDSTHREDKEEKINWWRKPEIRGC